MTGFSVSNPQLFLSVQVLGCSEVMQALHAVHCHLGLQIGAGVDVGFGSGNGVRAGVADSGVSLVFGEVWATLHSF